MFYTGDRLQVQPTKAYLTHNMTDKFILKLIMCLKPQVDKLGTAYSEE